MEHKAGAGGEKAACGMAKTARPMLVFGIIETNPAFVRGRGKENNFGPASRP